MLFRKLLYQYLEQAKHFSSNLFVLSSCLADIIFHSVIVSLRAGTFQMHKFEQINLTFLGVRFPIHKMRTIIVSHLINLMFTLVQILAPTIFTVQNLPISPGPGFFMISPASGGFVILKKMQSSLESMSDALSMEPWIGMVCPSSSSITTLLMRNGGLSSLGKMLMGNLWRMLCWPSNILKITKSLVESLSS